MSDTRRRAFSYKAERQAAFQKTVRKEFLDESRKRKDTERARMEAYRRLCKKEGIQSARLDEYDRIRRDATDQLSKALEQVDYDETLTNTEKKRRKYNLKRKFASTTVTDLVTKKEKKYNAVTSVENTQRKREEEREAAKKAREDRIRERDNRMQARKERNSLYAKRTKRGQPVLASRMESLLQKITK